MHPTGHSGENRRHALQASRAAGVSAASEMCLARSHQLQMAFCDLEVEAIYLLSDGKPDTSTQHVLKEVAKMNEHRKLKIHTMSFHCDDKSANSFLKVHYYSS